MPRMFLMTCARCGKSQRVPRKEIDRARGPHCSACGGPLELSRNAEEQLGKSRSGGVKPAKATPRPVERLIPEREAKRYEFWEWPDLYQWACRRLPEFK